MVDSNSQNNTYHAKIVSQQVMANNNFKLYWVNFLKRDPKKYTWENSGIDQIEVVKGIERIIREQGLEEQPGTTIAFPHVATFYRLGLPSKEEERSTNSYIIGRSDPRDLAEMKLRSPYKGENRAISMGCFMETRIFDREMGFLFETNISMNNYINKFALPVGYTLDVKDPDKIKNYLESLQKTA